MSDYLYSDNTSFEDLTFTGNNTSSSKGNVNKFENRLEVVELMVQGIFATLKKHDIKEEEFFNEIQNIIDKKKTYGPPSKIYECPSCHRKMQIVGNPFTANCLYCGTEKLINPYGDYDDIQPEAGESGDQISTDSDYGLDGLI